MHVRHLRAKAGKDLYINFGYLSFESQNTASGLFESRHIATGPTRLA